MTSFASRLRARDRLIGFWIVLGCEMATERIARTGYDYVCFDAQHGLHGYDAMVRGMLAVDAGAAIGPTPTVSLVRVESGEPAAIGHALDAGATGVIVPLVDDAGQAAAAVRASRYPTDGGIRSYGPMRSQLRIGPAPHDVADQVVVLAMIETATGLANVHEICATPGLAGVYVGPSDLALGLGAQVPGDPAITEAFEAALVRVRTEAERAGIAAGIHTPDGATASRRLSEGFTFASIASDVTYLEAAARDQLATSRR